jgi:N-acetylmuramoyl-L-alanine amidase
MGAIVGQYYESRINLAIALKLKNILESKGIKVYMARTEENNPETPYLSERVRMINLLHPNVVISIHANANPYSKSIRGYEIYYRKAYDRFLAKSIDKSMDLISPIPKHKDPQYMKLIILSGWPPSVLIETGYMTNSQDLSILLNDNYQSAIAQSIAEGVLTFLGSDNR